MRLYVSCLLLVLVTALLVPISAGAQESADCVAIIDANGTRVARWQGSSTVLFDHQGRVARLSLVTNTRLDANANLFFTGANCTGDEYMIWETPVQPEAHGVGTDIWYPDTTATAAPQFINSSEAAESGQCNPVGSTMDFMVPAFNFTLPTFTPPYHLEPEACFTPSPMVSALTPYALGAMVLVLALSAYLMMKRPEVA